LLKFLLTDTLHFVSGVTEEATIAFILRNLEKYIPYIVSIRNFAKKWLKKLLEIWGSSNETCRIVAFMNIRELALQFPSKQMLDVCLKGIYLTYVRNSKFINATSIKLVNFMANCVVEIYSLNFISSYQHAFVYVRQLAIHLRNSLHLKTKEAFRNVYNWQFINSLKVWTLVLSTNMNDEMKPLLYPLIQIIIGVLRLVPTSKYFPLRFHCIRMLNQLSASSQVFIHTAPYIIECLQAAEFTRKNLNVSKPIDFSLNVKVSKASLRTKAFQEATITQVYELLLSYYSSHSRSISFPELAFPTTVQLRNFTKGCKIVGFKKKMQQVLEQLEKNAQFVKGHRQNVELNIQKLDELKNFLADSRTPLQDYFEQFKQNEAKNKIAEENDDGDEEEGDSDEEMEVDLTLPPLNTKKEKAPAPKKEAPASKAKKAKKSKNVEEDVVEDFVLSDDD